jgi:hypothetical protein
LTEVNYANLEAMDETLYEGLAHEAVFSVPRAGTVRFAFSDRSASGYVRCRDGSLLRIRFRERLRLPAGKYVLTLYDPRLVAHVSIVFMPD